MVLSPLERLNYIKAKFVDDEISDSLRILRNDSFETEFNVSTALKQLLRIFIEEHMYALCGTDEVLFKRLCEEAVEECLRMVTNYKSSTNGRIGIQEFLLTYNPNDREWSNWQPRARPYRRIILPLSENQQQRLGWIDPPANIQPVERTRNIFPTVDMLYQLGWSSPTQQRTAAEASKRVHSFCTVLLVNERGMRLIPCHQELIKLGWRPPAAERLPVKTSRLTQMLVEFLGTLPERSFLTVKEEKDLALIPSDK